MTSVADLFMVSVETGVITILVFVIVVAWVHHKPK